MKKREDLPIIKLYDPQRWFQTYYEKRVKSAVDSCSIFLCVISEQDKKVIYAKAMMFSPYATFEVMPIISVEEAIEAVKKVQP